MKKCGLTEVAPGQYEDTTTTAAYIWSEENWQHDDYLHSHNRHQLTYVSEGYQYFHIGQRIYLVPQHHAIWIPSKVSHRITSNAETVDLLLLLFQEVPAEEFYNEVHIFPVPDVLKEMLLYARKWNRQTTATQAQASFLSALLYNLPAMCNESNGLQIPVPHDIRLLPIVEYLNKHYAYAMDLPLLAEKTALSVRTLQRIFKQETGITIQKYAQLIRILKSIEFINSKQYTLSEVAYKVGYKSLSAFTAAYYTLMKSKPKLLK